MAGTFYTSRTFPGRADHDKLQYIAVVNVTLRSKCIVDAKLCCHEVKTDNVAFNVKLEVQYIIVYKWLYIKFLIICHTGMLLRES